MRAATNFAAWWTEARWVWTVCLRLLPDSIAAVIWTEAFCAWDQHANHSAAKALKASIILHRKVRKLHESTDLDWTRNFPRLFLRQFAACTTAAGHVAA